MSGSYVRLLRAEASPPAAAPLQQHRFQRANLRVEQTKGGNQCHAERRNWRQQITPELREVEVEVGRGKTVLEAVKKIGVTEQTYSLGRRSSVGFESTRRSG